MLRILFVFLYMGVTCMSLGYGLLSFLLTRKLFCTKRGAYRIRHRLSYLLAGVVCVTVYAELFSLFAPVGLVANLLLVALCALILWYYRRQLFDRLMARTGYAMGRRARGRLPDGYLLSRRIWLLYILLTLVVAYGTSHGIMHYDTGLYHAQSIRFIEEYGVVRGIANLHGRLGYNSASFAFSALYSFAFAGGRPLHAGAGFFALLLSFACLDIKHLLRRGRPVLADFVRLAGLYYLFNIFKEMVSPAPDYFLNCYLFCLLILWVELDVRHERHFFPYAMLAAGVCFAVTIKLSAVALLLLCAKPIVLIAIDAGRKEPDTASGRVLAAYGIGIRSDTAGYKHAFIKEDRQAASFRGVRKQSPGGHITRVILGFTGVFAAIALPWFVRNLLISGWMLYPSTVPKLISFPWQVPHDLVEGDAEGIRAYARGSAPGVPIGTWIRSWFYAQPVSSRILVVGDFAALLGFIAYLTVCVASFVKRYRKRMKRRNFRVVNRLTPILRLSRAYLLYNSDFLFLEGVLLLSFLFWFLQAPLIRYGFFFVWAPPVLFAGRVIMLLLSGEPEDRANRITAAFAVFLAAFLCYKGIRLLMTDRQLMRAPYLLTQQDYERFDVIPYEIGGVTFYYPAEGDCTGYDGFPGGDHRADFGLLGESLRDGLRAH